MPTPAQVLPKLRAVPTLSAMRGPAQVLLKPCKSAQVLPKLCKPAQVLPVHLQAAVLQVLQCAGSSAAAVVVLVYSPGFPAFFASTVA